MLEHGVSLAVIIHVSGVGEESVGFGDRKNAPIQGYDDDDDDDDETGDLSQSFCHSLCSFQEKLLPPSICVLSSRTMCHHHPRDGEGGDADVDEEPLHDRRRRYLLHFLRCPERRSEL